MGAGHSVCGTGLFAAAARAGGSSACGLVWLVPRSAAPSAASCQRAERVQQLQPPMPSPATCLDEGEVLGRRAHAVGRQRAVPPLDLRHGLLAAALQALAREGVAHGCRSPEPAARGGALQAAVAAGGSQQAAVAAAEGG